MTDLFTAPVRTQVDPALPGPGRRARRQRRQRRRVGRGRAVIVLLVALTLVGGAGYAVWVNVGSLIGLTNPFEAKDFPGPGVDEINIEIYQGATGTDMGEELYDAGVVASVGAFTQAFEANPDSVLIRPGTHAMLKEMSAQDAVALLVKNETVDPRLTIPEGYTVDQIVERAVEVTGLPTKDFTSALKTPEKIGLPKQAGGQAEGWLYPGTYPLDAQVSAEKVLSKMVARTQVELKKKKIPAHQWQTVLIKASLVEREGRSAEDKPKIARAIENRLADDMILQIDAAVAYGAGKSGADLTREDLNNADNPYNTYEHPGLPPGPIANPGSVSIDAVLNPAPGAWKYWVTVNLDTGETRFSETYEQHVTYQQELRDWQASQRTE